MTLLLASAQLYRMIDNIKTLQFYSGLFHIIFCFVYKNRVILHSHNHLKKYPP